MKDIRKLKKIRFALVYNRDNRLNEDGTSVVQLRAYLAGKNRFFSTGIYVEPKYWDHRYHRVKETHPLEHQYNQHLREMLQEFKDRELKLRLRYGYCPLRLLDGEEAAELEHETFTQLCKAEIERPEIRYGTRRTQRSSLAKLFEYRREILFEDLTYPFIVGYDRFLRRQGLSVNTIDNHHRILKRYINTAIAYAYLSKDANPYDHFNSKTEDPNRVVLSEEELLRLERLQIPRELEHLERMRKIFLFCCYTGLRFGDVTRLAAKHLEELPQGLELKMRLEKTGRQHTLPLWLLFRRPGDQVSRPETIVREEMTERGKLYRRASLTGAPLFRVTNQYFNRALKELADLAGIKKRLTSHVGRRTFAVFMSTRVAPAVLQKLLGHEKIDTTMIYVQLSNQIVENELRKIDWD